MMEITDLISIKQKNADTYTGIKIIQLYFAIHGLLGPETSA